MTHVYTSGGAEAIESAYQLLVEGKELDKTLTLESEVVTPDTAEELLAKYSGSEDGEAAEETTEDAAAEEEATEETAAEEETADDAAAEEEATDDAATEEAAEDTEKAAEE